MAPFLTTNWIFKNEKIKELEKKLSIEDVQAYGFQKIFKKLNKNYIQYLADSSLIVQQEIFKLEMNIEKNKKKLWR